MILKGIDTDVNGNVESKACKIEANPVMYDILSNRLYRNKVRAVVRELSTNAIDSHKKAGTEGTPIKVQLPTILEPSFIIRDFGTGLCEQDIYDLYMTYGASDKRESNLFNGALGVGSKSPFAYTQAFSVTSYFDGEATTYSVFSENGEPKIAKLGAVKSDEPTGLSIEVPVDDRDITKFTREAEYVYTFLGHPVETNFEIDTLFKGEEPRFKDKGWELYGSLDGSYLVMAGVGYNLKGLGVTDADILDTNGLVLYAETGDVQFAASREELSLSPDTVAKLQELAKNMNDSFEAIVDDALSKEEGLVDIARVSSGMPREFRNAVAKKFPELMSSYYSGLTLRWPNDVKVTTRTSSWNDRYNTIHSVPQGYIKNPDSYEVILLDVVSKKSAIVRDYYPSATNVIFINSTERKTKENAKSRFDTLLKRFGITKYKYASDFKFASAGKSGTTTKSPAVKALDKSWNYTRIEKVADGEFEVKYRQGALNAVMEDDDKFYPMAMNRDYNVIETKDGHTRTYYDLKGHLAEYIKVTNQLEVGDVIFLVEVPKANVQALMNKGGQDWKDLCKSGRKQNYMDYSDLKWNFERLGWDYPKYSRGELTHLEPYLPRDVKRELGKMDKVLKARGGSINNGVISRLNSMVGIFKQVGLKPKLEIVSARLPEDMIKKYQDLLHRNVYGDYHVYAKMIDITHNKMVKLKEESGKLLANS